MRYLFILVTVIIFILSFPFLVHAQEAGNGCQPIYGGGPSCLQSGNLTLDKKIRNPSTNQFVDHLSVTDPKHTADQTITFQITVKNTGNRALDTITVTDIFPQYVAFSKGPGQFDKGTNTLTFGLNRLEAGQSRSIMLEGKVLPANQLPQGAGLSCVVNQARAEKDRNIGTDNTQFCLTVTGQNPAQSGTPTPPPSNMPVYDSPNVSTAPKTGPELLALVGLIPAGAIGIYLRRKST